MCVLSSLSHSRLKTANELTCFKAEPRTKFRGTRGEGGGDLVAHP